MITGEPTPARRSEGDKVFAGTILKQGTIRFRAEATGDKTMLAQIIRMVQEAQGSKAPVQRVADKIARVFVPAVLCLSLITFIYGMLSAATVSSRAQFFLPYQYWL